MPHTIKIYLLIFNNQIKCLYTKWVNRCKAYTYLRGKSRSKFLLKQKFMKKNVACKIWFLVFKTYSRMCFLRKKTTIFFVANTIIIFCFICWIKNKFVKNRPFLLNHQNFQKWKLSSHIQRVFFWYIIPCESVKINY